MPVVNISLTYIILTGFLVVSLFRKKVGLKQLKSFLARAIYENSKLSKITLFLPECGLFVMPPHLLTAEHLQQSNQLEAIAKIFNANNHCHIDLKLYTECM
jgi:hypothetical protein